MKSKMINILKSISKELQLFLAENNNLCVDRNRKNDIIDAILYKLYYTKLSATQEKVTIKLNSFKTRKNKCSRQALAKKDKKLNVSFYEKLSLFLAEQIKKHNKTVSTRQVIAVDGVFSTFLKSLEKDGFKANKKGESVTPLISGLFNITYNCPVTLDLVKTRDERRAFMDFAKNKEMYKDNIFVFDRGYVDKNMFKCMNDKKLFFLCRLRDNNKYISSIDDNIVIEDGYKLRIIKYIINDKPYYVASNIIDYSKDMIQNIYHCYAVDGR